MSETKSTLNPKLWVKTFSDTLYRFAVSRVSNTEIAKDLVQETFLAALRNVETFKGEISEKNWLFMILKNKIIDHYRKKASSLFFELNELLESTNPYFDENDHWTPDTAPRDWGLNYSSTVESKEFYEILNKCMDKLSEIMKIVFTLKYLDERESDEICKELNITSSNYWVIMHRAKLQLRGCLEKKWI